MLRSITGGGRLRQPVKVYEAFFIVTKLRLVDYGARLCHEAACRGQLP